MEIKYKVVYHHFVVRDDIPKLSEEWKGIIQHAIENRLLDNPDLYSKPLRRSLKGYRKFRVGDWRIILRIEKTTIKIFTIQHRSVVYKVADKRIQT